mgnify:CR=1 FL=1
MYSPPKICAEYNNSVAPRTEISDESLIKVMNSLTIGGMILLTPEAK